MAGGHEGAASSRWQQFADYAGRTSDPNRRADLYVQAARLSEEAGVDATITTDLYCNALEANPVHSGALLSLERLCLRSSNWRLLYTVYGLRAEVLSTEEREATRAELFAKMARVALEHLDDPELAAACYENLLEVDPGEPEAVRFLLHAHEEAGNWQAIESLLRSQIPEVSDPLERAELLRLLGDSLYFAEERPEPALEAYREAHETDPQNRDAFYGLVRVLDHLHRTEELAKVCASRIEALERVRGNVTAEAELFDLRLQLFDLLDGGNPETRKQARAALEAAEAMRPENPEVLRRVARLARHEGDFERAAVYYRNLLEHLPMDSPLRAETALALAGVEFRNLGRAREAGEWLEAVLAEGLPEPLERQAHRLRADMAAAGEDWDRAIEAYTAVLERTPSEEKAEISEIRSALAAIHERCGNVNAALAQYDYVLALFPRFKRALRERARLLFEHGYWKKAHAATMDYLDVLKGPGDEEERARIEPRLARIYEEIGDPERAAERYRTILSQRREDPLAGEGLARIYESMGQPEKATPLWEVVREHHQCERDETAFVAVTEHLARNYQIRGMTNQARSLYELVLAREPGRRFSLERLAELSEINGQWGRARDLYRRLSEALDQDTPEERRAEIELRLRRAERNAFYEEPAQ